MKEGKVKNIICQVYPGSIGEEAGIAVGDKLIAINGQYIEDIIEYKYCLAEEYLEVEIEKPNGEAWILEIEKGYDDDLGIEFDNPILTHMRSCQNKCIFCFIDQLPKGMRESLYFKDDDSRLSFLHGNYITLTNMREEDIKKIIQYRISPINVSVHTTNGELRKRMLNNRFADNILDILKRLVENDITVNCQIVLCPGVNDGEELDNTLRDLAALGKGVESVAVVPVGITQYRQGLPQLKAFDKETAAAAIDQVNRWQSFFRYDKKSSFVYISDEFYILADREFPSVEDYEGFPQLENGVGMVAKLERDFLNYLSRLPQGLKVNKRVTIVTGTLAYPFINSLAKKLEGAVHGLKVKVLGVKNQFFGGHVSVSGLLTGQDVLRELSAVDAGDCIIIPESMLKSGEEIFLDDFTVSDLQQRLDARIVVSPVDGRKLIQKILYK